MSNTMNICTRGTDLRPSTLRSVTALVSIEHARPVAHIAQNTWAFRGLKSGITAWSPPV